MNMQNFEDSENAGRMSLCRNPRTYVYTYVYRSITSLQQIKFNISGRHGFPHDGYTLKDSDNSKEMYKKQTLLTMIATASYRFRRITDPS